METRTVLWMAVFLLGLVAGPVAAQEGHHGGMKDRMGKSTHGMMMQKGDCMEAMGEPCPMCAVNTGKKGKAAGPMREMHGMMMGGASPSFYLDMKEDLGLDSGQVERLQQIRSDFKKERIRRSAELKVSKLELEDALRGEWTVDGVEKQLRQMLQARIDLAVRYLKARKKADQVLTEEQLRQVQGMAE